MVYQIALTPFELNKRMPKGGESLRRFIRGWAAAASTHPVDAAAAQVGVWCGFGHFSQILS